MKIVFFGTPDFAAEILKDLVAKGRDIVAVVTRPDKPKGRSSKLLPPHVKEISEQILSATPVFQPTKASDPQFIEQLKNLNADLFVVVAYGQILKQNLLDLPPKGCINIHASLLPKYRGAAPIQRSIIEGENETGITIMQMTLGLDAGDMLYQLKTPISLQMNAQELRSKLCELSKEAINHVLDHFDTIVPIKQDDSKVTFAPKIEIEDGLVNWNKSALSLHNQIRGVYEDIGAYCKILLKGEEKILKIYSTEITPEVALPGTIISFGKTGIVVAAKEGSLKLLQVQLEGKKSMSAKDFACGYKKEDIKFI